MHIVFHIHSFLYYARLLGGSVRFFSFLHYARLLGSSVRFLGAMLLMALFSLPQLVSAKPASVMFASEENRRSAIDFFCRCSAVNILGSSDLAADPRYCGGDGTDRVPPDAMAKSSHTGVFYRFKPGIVAVPRMNRTPKPKSVYRCFTRAPGLGRCRGADA